jgi:hypothetical protein
MIERAEKIADGRAPLKRHGSLKVTISARPSRPT